MANEKVKVVGYAQRVFFDNGIEYRNFSDDLVGQQFASESEAPLFTIGNFTITTNLERRASKLFNQNKFSSFYTLDDLTQNTTIDMVDVLQSNINVKLNLDKSNLSNYAFFGSLVEYVRVSLEEIITEWPASLYVSKSKETSQLTGLTVENYTYDSLEENATFKISTNRLTNNYGINYLDNGQTVALNTGSEDLKNLSVSFLSYVVDVDDEQFDVIGFTGSSSAKDDYIYLEVEGDPFSSTTSLKSYHIRPNNDHVELFFNSLPDLQSYLLNRETTPKYTSTFRFPVRSDNGIIFYQERELTWPVSDGYNIDFSSSTYVIYVSELLDIATNFDENKTDIVSRQLVAEAVSDFDTFPKCDGTEEISEGQKINRTLKIYGRGWDEIKKYIDGIKLANRVTYNKKDNVPDVMLKYLARTMGWEMVSSILENDLLMSYLRPSDPSYSGITKGLTPYEAEIELWRRLILNSPWIWKSKGHRKVIEFFLKFIGAPKDLIQFNEYVWVAKKPVDVELMKGILDSLGRDASLINSLNFDSEGYPRAPRNNADMYFQKGGLWYRETGGVGSVVDVTTGNNPHLGPYDGGKEYIDQFRCLIPDFSAVTVTKENVTTELQNIFTNYNSGLVNNTTQNLSYDVLNLDGVPITDCFTIEGEIIEDPKPSAEITDCGCETGEGDDAIKFSIYKEEPATGTTDCGYSAFTFDSNGYVEFSIKDTGNTSYAIPRECCTAIGQTPEMVDGAWWCRWKEPSGCEGYTDYALTVDGTVIWQDPKGNETTVVPSSECCDVRKEYSAVTADSGRGYECVIPCVGIEDVAITTEGVVIWEDSSGRQTTTVDFAQCCDVRKEYTAVEVDGGYQCVVELPADCLSWSPTAVELDGTVVWTPDDGSRDTTVVSSEECCTNYGYDSVVVRGGFECIDRNATSSSVSSTTTTI